MGPFAETVAKTSRLAGQKILVPGNHDRVHPVYRGSEAKKAEWADMYEAAGWTIAPLQIELELRDGTMIDLCHFPRTGDSHGEDRYVEQRPAPSDRWLIHGHVHEAWKINAAQREINVGVDVQGFCPVSLAEVAEMIKTA